jgi:hypothetical protein
MNLMLFTLLGNILCIPCRMNNGRKNGKIISLFDLFHSHGDLDYYFYNSSESSDYEDYHNEAATTKEIELTSKKYMSYQLPHQFLSVLPSLMKKLFQIITIQQPVRQT